MLRVIFPRPLVFEYVALGGGVGQLDLASGLYRNRGSIFGNDRLAVIQLAVKILGTAKIFRKVDRCLKSAGAAVADGQMFRPNAECQPISGPQTSAACRSRYLASPDAD